MPLLMLEEDRERVRRRAWREELHAGDREREHRDRRGERSPRRWAREALDARTALLPDLLWAIGATSLLDPAANDPEW